MDNVTVKFEHWKALQDANAELDAIQRMMDLFQSQCQARVRKQQDRVREVWAKIASETKADLINVLWEPHPTDAVIIPVQQNFRRPQ